VRSSDNSGWRPWKTSLVSEVLQCTSDVPFNPTAPSPTLSYSGGRAVDNEDNKDGGGGEGEGGDGGSGGAPVEASTDAARGRNHEHGASQAQRRASGRASSRAPTSDQGGDLGVHALPSIKMSWSPGSANGAPIEECVHGHAF